MSFLSFIINALPPQATMAAGVVVIGLAVCGCCQWVTSASHAEGDKVKVAPSKKPEEVKHPAEHKTAPKPDLRTTVGGKPDGQLKFGIKGYGNLTLENWTTHEFRYVITDAPAERVVNRQGQISLGPGSISASRQVAAGRPVCIQGSVSGLPAGHSEDFVRTTKMVFSRENYVIAAWKDGGWLMGAGKVHVVRVDTPICTGQTFRFQQHHLDSDGIGLPLDEKEWTDFVTKYTAV